MMDSCDLYFRCVEISNEMILVTDRAGKILTVNPAWERVYGYSKEEAIGQTPRILHSGHQTREFYARMWEQLLDPKRGTWKGTVINRTRSGSLIPVLLTISPYRSASGELLGFIGAASDITEQKELEAKLIHQDRLASIGLLASGLAHEVGTPLGVIRGRAELLLMQAAEDPNLLRSLEVIMGQIDRISKLIRSLLRVSRASPPSRMKSVPVLEVVNEVISLVTQNLRKDMVEIRIQVEPSLHAMADPHRLEQVLLNLAMNSIYAIRKAIETGTPRKHFLAIEGSVKDAFVCLRVTDSGCGIDAENRKHLFEPFFTTKTPAEGTGLGLAIVAKIMEEMQGEITVESTPDVGTTFTLYLNRET